MSILPSTGIPVGSQQVPLKQPVYPLFGSKDKDMHSVPWRSNNGYAAVMRGNVLFQAHIIVMERKIKRKLTAVELVDHLNRNRLDNRRKNLVIADRVMNAQNRGIHSNNTTGQCGVYRYGKKWIVGAGYMRRFLYVGVFHNYEEAVAIAEKVRVDLKFWGRTHEKRNRVTLAHAKMIVSQYRNPLRCTARDNLIKTMMDRGETHDTIFAAVSAIYPLSRNALRSAMSRIRAKALENDT